MRRSLIVILGLIFFLVITNHFFDRVGREVFAFNVFNPFYLLVVAIITYLWLDFDLKIRWKYKKKVFEWVIIISLFYIILYFVLGLIDGYGHNPYDNSFKGLLINFWTIGTIIITQEYVRAVLINKGGNNKKKVFLLIYVIYILIAINFNYLFENVENGNQKISFLVGFLLPVAIENLFLNYIAMIGGYVPTIIYRLITTSIYWLSPILPNHSWLVKRFFDFFIPLFGFWIIYYKINKKEKKVKPKDISSMNPLKWIPSFLLLFIMIAFIIGLFPTYPLVVYSDSMKPSFRVGDIVLMKKEKIDKIEIGDVIGYISNKNIIVHRVIQKNNQRGNIVFITKGDNNPNVDQKSINKEQVIGKVIYVIPKIGYPSIWFRKLFNYIDVTVSINNRNEVII